MATGRYCEICVEKKKCCRWNVSKKDEYTRYVITVDVTKYVKIGYLYAQQRIEEYFFFFLLIFKRLFRFMNNTICE